MYFETVFLNCILQMYFSSCIKPSLFSSSWWVVDAVVAKVGLSVFCEGTCSFCKRVQFDQALDILCNLQQIHKKSKNFTIWNFSYQRTTLYIIQNHKLIPAQYSLQKKKGAQKSMLKLNMTMPSCPFLNFWGFKLLGRIFPPFCFLQVKYSWERKME